MKYVSVDLGVVTKTDVEMIVEARLTESTGTLQCYIMRMIEFTIEDAL